MTDVRTVQARIVLPDESGLTQTRNVLSQGGVIVIPTDTVYGVGADIRHPDAVARLYHVKGRPEGKPIPVLVSSIASAGKFTSCLSETELRLMERYWPGGLTLVVPASNELPPEVTGSSGFVGLRMPDDSVALNIIEQAGGALAVTSANLSGDPEALTAQQARAAIGTRVDLIIDGGPARGGTASTVIQVIDRELIVLRNGAIPATELQEAFRQIVDDRHPGT